jgi:uncharacterized membrane protein
MRLGRLFRHLALPDWWLLRAFPKSSLKAIEQATAASEHVHQGEVRFVVEANLPLHGLLHHQSARARAIELFSRLRLWDTEHNSGVLVYIQLLDRRVEIVADRGIASRVDAAFWGGVCRRLEAAFGQGQYEAGALAALSEITVILAEHFPASADNPDELANTPVVL